MTKGIKPIETIEVDQETFYSDEFKPKGRFYYRDPFGNYIYILVRKREQAQEYIDKKYGINKFIFPVIFSY